MAFSTINLDSVNIGNSKKNSTPTAKEMPFHLLILGNFSGDNSKKTPLKPISVDRDNFDEIFARISPVLNLSRINERLTLTELDQFEPDYLYSTLDIFSQLRSLKRRLSNTNTFADAAEEINRWSQTDSELAAQPTQVEEVSAESEINENSGSLLDSILNSSEQQQSNNQHTQPGIAQQIIRDVIAPYITPATNPKQPEYIKITDAAVSDEMSQILHTSQFQALESLWRGLYFLVRRLVTDSKLKIFIADISKAQLLEELTKQGPSSELYRNLIEPYNSVNSHKSWSVIFGHYQFGSHADDVSLLKTLSSYAAECDANFIAEATSTLFECDDIAQQPDYESWNHVLDSEWAKQWNELRNSPLSNHIALGYPRFLLRIPYGNKGGSVENFEYEEMPSPQHNNFLWSNGGLAISYILAASYSEFNWQFKLGQLNEIDRLPVYYYDDEYGDKVAYPSAEILLTEKAAEKITAAGITPCWTVRDSDKIRVGPFVSLSNNATIIAGRWLA